MDLSPYVEQLRRELVASAEVGGDEARALAERLTAPAGGIAAPRAAERAVHRGRGDHQPAGARARSTSACAAATSASSSRPRRRRPRTAGRTEPAPAPAPAAPDTEDGGTARITLRLPEQLKARVEDAAGREGFSVNTWLVRAVTRGLEPGEGSGSADRRKKWSGQHYSGWVR